MSRKTPLKPGQKAVPRVARSRPGQEVRECLIRGKTCSLLPHDTDVHLRQLRHAIPKPAAPFPRDLVRQPLPNMQRVPLHPARGELFEKACTRTARVLVDGFVRECSPQHAPASATSTRTATEDRGRVHGELRAVGHATPAVSRLRVTGRPLRPGPRRGGHAAPAVRPAHDSFLPLRARRPFWMTIL